MYQSKAYRFHQAKTKFSEGHKINKPMKVTLSASITKYFLKVSTAMFVYYCLCILTNKVRNKERNE